MPMLAFKNKAFSPRRHENPRNRLEATLPKKLCHQYFHWDRYNQRKPPRSLFAKGREGSFWTSAILNSYRSLESIYGIL